MIVGILYVGILKLFRNTTDFLIIIIMRLLIYMYEEKNCSSYVWWGWWGLLGQCMIIKYEEENLVINEDVRNVQNFSQKEVLSRCRTFGWRRFIWLLPIFQTSLSWNLLISVAATPITIWVIFRFQSFVMMEKVCPYLSDLGAQSLCYDASGVSEDSPNQGG